MWNAEQKPLQDIRGLQVSLSIQARPATFAEVITAWQTDAAFRSMFNSLLAAAPYAAFRWETPGVTHNTCSQPFEFVILDSPGLDRRPDREAFATHFPAAEKNMAVFSNLGRDAVLVVPTPVAESSAYGHLAAFVRLAPAAQRDALWAAVGKAMAARVGAQPVWLSTAGAGVSWLHVRLDDRPKYYVFEPYSLKPSEDCCSGWRSVSNA